MRGALVPIVVTICGAVLYHAASKSVPRSVHPIASIVGAYVAAILACGAAALVSPAARPAAASLRDFNWSIAGIGIGAALIEIGFLLAYRAGWPLNSANVVVNVCASLILIPLGALVFGERLTAEKAAGIALCLAGLFLITRR